MWKGFINSTSNYLIIKPLYLKRIFLLCFRKPTKEAALTMPKKKKNGEL